MNEQNRDGDRREEECRRTEGRRNLEGMKHSKISVKKDRRKFSRRNKSRRDPGNERRAKS